MNSDRAREDAALRFVALQSPGILLLSFNFTKLPGPLRGVSLGHCIYWGAGDYVPSVQGKLSLNSPISPNLSSIGFQAKNQCAQLNCISTSIIMAAAYTHKVGNSLRDIQEHPSSADLLDLSESCWLSPMRNATRSVLISNNMLAKSLYEVGPLPQYVLTYAKPQVR